MSNERPFLKKSFAGIVDQALDSLRSGRGGRVVLDDATEGSVLRTLVEAFARELAVSYEQLEAVYQAGYLDTAAGAALDNVVDLLGVERVQAGWLEGEVVFSRATPAPFDIDIPAGTLVAGKGVPAFETLFPATLASGQTEVRVPVRAVAIESGLRVDRVEPGAISVLQRPIAGIERVTNPGTLLPRRTPESDDDLRARARHAIRGGHTATVSALERAVLALGIIDVQVAEDPARPGRVEVVLGDEDLADATVAEVRRAVEEARPAGVRVDTYQAALVWIRVGARAQLDAALDVQDEAALRAALEADIRASLDGLGINQTVRWNKIRNLLAAHPLVADVALPRGPNDAPDWPLLPVDPLTGEPLPGDGDGGDGGPQRLLGSVDAPVGVFIGAGERARLHRVELVIEPPALPVWIDVDGVIAAGEDLDQTRAAVAAVLAEILPPEPLAAPVTITWDTLSTRLADQVAGVAAGSLRFVILHDRDGRVVTLADDATAAEQESFAVREAISVRHIRLRPAPVEGA